MSETTPVFSVPNLHRCVHPAMAAPFEFLVQHEDAAYARQLCEEAFRQIDVLETELTRFDPSSDVSRIRNLKPGQAIVIGLRTFECLKQAQLIAADTGGAFDVTVGALFEAWRTPEGKMRTPSAEELAEARARTGWQLLMMDEESHLVGVRVGGLQVDLGAIGKGFALDCAAEVFEEWGVTRALLSAGGSSVLALDAPEGEEGWPVNVGEKILLRQKAISGSGVAVQGRHILDPRTGKPVEGRVQAWSVAPGAAWADALSTAFFVMSTEEIEDYCRRNVQVSGIVVGDRKQYFNLGERT